MFEKTNKIVTKCPFEVLYTQSITKSTKLVYGYSPGKKYDEIFLSKSADTARMCGLGAIPYEPMIEVSEFGDTTVKMPFTLRAVCGDNDPFFQRANQVLKELKRGEHLDVQWCDPPSGIGLDQYRGFFRNMNKKQSMEWYKDLFLAIEEEYIVVCSEVQINDEVLESKYNQDLFEILKAVLSGVVHCVYALQDVMGVY